MKSLLAVCLFLSSFIALANEDTCHIQALALAERMFNRSVELVDFQSTTPGSYDQKYVGIFAIKAHKVAIDFHAKVACEMGGELKVSEYH